MKKKLYTIESHGDLHPYTITTGKGIGCYIKLNWFQKILWKILGFTVIEAKENLK